jgi:hypothetical protein
MCGPDVFLDLGMLPEDFFTRLLSPGRFFVNREFELQFQSPIRETVTWENFRGQLLDGRHTRVQETFLSHHVRIQSLESGASQPLLTIRSAFAANPSSPSAIHVTRWLNCRVWEAFDDQGAIGSRQVERCVEELVGSVYLAGCGEIEALRKELEGLIFHGFVGLSRLPLNSVEAPIPWFSLGWTGYFPDFNTGHICESNALALLQRQGSAADRLDWSEAKRLELFLRVADEQELSEGARLVTKSLVERNETETTLVSQLRHLFNEVSLTPYTGFVDNALKFAWLLQEQGGISLDAYVDFLTGLLRQTVYHLTAYDLITFHHQGANYPDALLLDALLRELLSLEKHAGQSPFVSDRSVARCRRRRRALLLGWWLYRLIQGLPVPDAPTSPGENARVLPLPHQRVPEVQLQQPVRRNRFLFTDRPIDWQFHRSLLENCLQELADPKTLRELGTALYLDRPFGDSKPKAALDLTPLLSYELFSRSVARQRVQRLQQLEPWLGSSPLVVDAQKKLDEMDMPGLKVPPPGRASQTVKLQDCWRLADDFVIRRPTPSTIRQVQAYFAWETAPPPFRDWHVGGLMPIPLPGSSLQEPTRLVFYDAEFRPVFECQVADEAGFQRLAASELPMPGLVVVQSSGQTTVASRFP